MRINRSCLGLAVLAACSAQASANLASNGNFDGPSSGCTAGATSLQGWQVTSGNIDIQSNLPGCGAMAGASGSTYYIDLTGSYAEYGVNNVGSISQTLSTVAGQQYQLSFAFGGNSQWQGNIYPNDSAIKAMDVDVNGALAGVYSMNTLGQSVNNANWQNESVMFTATGNQTMIAFNGLNGSAAPSDFGALLDNVSVTQAPEINAASMGSAVMLLLGGLIVLCSKARE